MGHKKFNHNLLRLVFIFCLFIFASSVQALDSVDIEADHLNYYPNNMELYASGNVQGKYRAYNIDTQDLFINYTRKLMTLNHGFKMISSSNYFQGDSLDYDMQSQSGTANDTSAEVGKIHLKGNSIVFSDRKIVLSQGEYTTCVEHAPHFTFKADRIDIYTDYGIVILNNTVYYIFNVPILYIPTYIVGKAKYGVLTSQTALPEVGSNQKDGFFVRERFGYFISPRNSGVLNLGYYAARGALLGFDHQYLPTDIDNNEIGANLYTGSTFPYNIDASYKYERKFNFSGAVPTISNFLSGTVTSDFKTSVVVSWRDYINYQYLSFFPKLTLKTADLNLNNMINYNWNVMASRLSENNGPMVHKLDYGAAFYKNFYFDEFNVVKPEVNYVHSAGIGASWDQVIGAINYKTNYNQFLYFDLTYNHRIFTKGARAFLYETYNVFDVNNIDFKVTTKLNYFDLSFRYKYNTEKGRIYDLEQQVGVVLDCMTYGLKYQLLNKSIGFYFSLL